MNYNEIHGRKEANDNKNILAKAMLYVNNVKFLIVQLQSYPFDPCDENCVIEVYLRAGRYRQCGLYLPV